MVSEGELEVKEAQKKKKPRLRRWFFGLFLVLLVLGGGLWMKMQWKPRSIESLVSLSGRRPLLVGHRGAAALAPENTLPSFQAAQDAGADGVEFDVMMTKDKHLVVFHDYKLEKRLPLRGTIREMTLAEIQKVDLSAYLKLRWKDKPLPPPFLGAQAPTLDALFAFYKNHPKVLLNIELKNEDIRDQGHEAATVALIKKYGYEKRVIASSFNPFSVRRFRHLAPEIPVGLIYDKTLAIYLRRLWLAGIAKPDALHPNFRMVNEAYMTWARNHGFSVNVWTVNEPDDIRRMIKLGVDMIISDYPDRLRAIYHEVKGQGR